jgi:predicted Zn-dependent protease
MRNLRQKYFRRLPLIRMVCILLAGAAMICNSGTVVAQSARKSQPQPSRKSQPLDQPQPVQPSQAQGPGPFMFDPAKMFDPSQMFERMFGEETPEDLKALAEIKITPKEEEQLSREAVQSCLDYCKQQNIAVTAKGKDVDYLQRLVNVVRPMMTQAARYKQITIYVADSPLCEARTLPGGTIIFFRGLLDSAESEAALVGVIGHELAHLDRDHLLVRLRQMKRAQQMMAGGLQNFTPQAMLNATSSMVRLWTRPFRPEDERQADLDGARWAYKAGYDPREMVRVIAKIGEREKNQPMAVPSMFRTHPPSEERRKAVLDLYAELQKQEPKEHLYIGKENLNRRITRAEKEFAE